MNNGETYKLVYKSIHSKSSYVYSEETNTEVWRRLSSFFFFFISNLQKMIDLGN